MNRRTTKKATTKHAQTDPAAVNRAGDRVARATEAATSFVQAVPMSVEQPDADPIVKINLGMSDFRTMAITYARGRIDQARSVAEDRRDALKRKVTDLATALSNLGRDVIAAYGGGASDDLGVSEQSPLPVIAEAYAMRAMLEKWTGKRYRIRLQKENYYHGYHGAENSWEPIADLERRQITGELAFCALAATGNVASNNWISELDREVVIPFTPAMNETLDAMNAAREELAEAEQDVKDLNRAMARVEERGDEVQTRLTFAHLSGKVKTTQDILAVVQATMFDNKALPPRVVALLPPPPEASA